LENFATRIDVGLHDIDAGNQDTDCDF